MTLELWRDAENDAERSCCAPRPCARRARWPTRLGLPHFTLDLRDEFRAGVVDPWLADHAAGLTPNPCVRCNGQRAPRRDARLRRPPRARERWPRATTRAATGEGLAAPRPPTPPRTRRYMLAALPPDDARAAAVPAGRADEARGARDGRASTGCRSPTSPTRRTCASSPARHASASWPATAELRERPGDVVDAAGTRSGRHRGAIATPSASARASGSARRRAALRAAHRRAANTRDRRPARGARRPTRPPARRAPAPRAAAVDAVKLRYRHAARCRRARLDVERPLASSARRRSRGAAPGCRPPCLLRGDVVVGYATHRTA